MKGAEAEDEVTAIDAGDIAVGEEVGQGMQRDAVVGIVKSRYEDLLVGDVGGAAVGGGGRYVSDGLRLE